MCPVPAPAAADAELTGILRMRLNLAPVNVLRGPRSQYIPVSSSILPECASKSKQLNHGTIRLKNPKPLAVHFSVLVAPPALLVHGEGLWSCRRAEDAAGRDMPTRQTFWDEI